MPTDLPPDYVPKPAVDPDSPTPPGQSPGVPKPNEGGDVVDPTGWRSPPVVPGDAVPAGVPTPAGTPVFRQRAR